MGHEMPRSVVLVQAAYILLASGLLAWKIGTPNILGISVVVLLGFLWAASSRSFVVALVPFVALILCYEQLRSFADELTPAALHITDLIEWERRLFAGRLPSVTMQEAFGDRFWGLASGVYATHFISPVIVAVMIWGRKREFYWRYIGGLLGLSYLGFLGYVLFPAAPPWWASHFGYIQEPLRYHLPAEVLLRSPNPVAAMPSLHAAYTVFLAGVVWRLWGRRAGLAMTLLPAAMAFATVYLAHHYVIDLIAGWLLAVPVLWAVFWKSGTGAEAATGEAPREMAGEGSGA